MNYLQFKTITSSEKTDVIVQYTNIHFESPKEHTRNTNVTAARVCVCVCVCVCLCVEEPRGKSKYTTCTKYTIFTVKPGCTWLPLDLKKSNIPVEITEMNNISEHLRAGY